MTKRYLVIDEHGDEHGSYPTWSDAAAYTLDNPDLSVIEVDDEDLEFLDTDCSCCSWTGLVVSANVSNNTSIGRHAD